MAKLQKLVNGNLNEFIIHISNFIQNANISCTLEDKSYLDYGSIKIAMISLERYSMFGGNRVSLTITAVERNMQITVIGMTAGGSQATFFKLNTLGENKFLKKLDNAILSWESLEKNC